MSQTGCAFGWVDAAACFSRTAICSVDREHASSAARSTRATLWITWWKTTSTSFGLRPDCAQKLHEPRFTPWTQWI